MQIPKHTFLITGGCSGLGKVTSFQLAEQGANIIVADLNVKACKKLAGDFKNRFLCLPTDVTDPTSIKNALFKSIEYFGEIHGLINCAGILVSERMIKRDGELFNLALFRQCLDVNLTGTFNMIQQSSPIMAKNRPNTDSERGVIVNTSSIAAYEGQVGQAAYAASKAGIIGMTLPIARELGTLGIRVMTIAPGVFATPLFTEFSEEKLNQLEQQIPFPPRLGKSSEFATLVQHIIENPMLNGETIRLDGALRLS